MTLQQLIARSVFGTIGTVKDDESLNKVYGFLKYNKPFLDHFPRIAVALNKVDGVSPELVIEYKKIWTDMFPQATCWSDNKNRGHMFGTIDLDESLLKYCKHNFPRYPFLFKSADDVLMEEKLLTVNLGHADFYYMPSLSYETIELAGGLQSIKESLILHRKTPLPQTNFYVINLEKIDSLYGSTVKAKQKIYRELAEKQLNIKPWEIKYEDGIKFDMETLLYQTTKDLSKFLLLSDECLRNLCNFVYTNGVGDPSHKNIMFDELGLCHFHEYTKAVYVI